jgi:hypothetical protein
VFVPGKYFQPSPAFREKHSSLLRIPYITAIISFMIQAPGHNPEAIFTTLHFLRDLWMCQKSWSVRIHRLELLKGTNSLAREY